VSFADQPGPPADARRADRLSVRLTRDPIDPAQALARVADARAGAQVLFTGTVRDHSDAGSVTGLEYEAWEDRGSAALEAIGQELFDRWPVCAAALWHRFGSLAVGDVSVIVCVSAPHRADAFEAARHGIERIKADVPIWKKELLTAGDGRWVMGS
jgi:molybdopterin synthase catalytic subunit